jgi:hypothetical protein
MTTLPKPDEDDLAELAQSVWDKRDQGIAVDIETAKNRPISSSDIEYLRSRCPYIQILNMEATFENYKKVRFISAKSGWTIQDLDDGLCTSIGPYLFGGADSPSIENADSKDSTQLQHFVNKGKGTLVKQAVDTAEEMALIAKTRWKGGIEIIGGSELMKRALWIFAQIHQVKLIGYEPDENAKRILKNVNHLNVVKSRAPKPRNAG